MNGMILHTRLEEFTNYLKTEERSQTTIAKYQRDLKLFFTFLLNSNKISKDTLIAYKENLTAQYAVNSVNSMLAAVNTFLKFIGHADLMVKPLKTQRRIFSSREEELTREEYQALLSTAQRLGKKRLWFLLQTICSTGIRVSELEFVTVEAVRQRRATVSCKGKSRIVFLPRDLCRALLEYCETSKILSGKIFITKNGKPLDRSNIWKEMKQLCKPAGVSLKKVFPHNLRHLFAKTYYHVQKDLARLADILGHSSVETTRLYILSTGDEQEEQVCGLGLLAS